MNKDEVSVDWSEKPYRNSISKNLENQKTYYQ